jgi:Glycosyl hydrolase family 85
MTNRDRWAVLAWRAAVALLVGAGLGACGKGPAVPPGPPAPAAPVSTCAPSFCVETAADMNAWKPEQVPLSQRATATFNASLAAGFRTSRLFAATDLAGNFVKPRMNDYTNAFQGAGDTGNIYNFSQWPYVGLVYYYNHAPMAVPPTGWINAAHRHGTPILGVMTGDCGAGCDRFAKAINEFYADAAKAATQMALIANTYGFDGWLIDIESGVDSNRAIAVMTALRPKPGPGGRPLILLYYEGGVNDLSGQAAQATFNAAGYFQSDYGTGDPSATYNFVIGNAAPNDNPFTTSYSRYVYRFARDATCTSSPSQISNGGACLDTQGMFASLSAIRRSPTDYYQAPGLYAVGWERWGGPNLNAGATRAQVQQAHRDLFVGFGAVPSGASCRPTPPAASSVAAFVDAAGVALSSPFVTRFNTGEGDSFTIQGVAAASTPWNGLGLQDVQPTWLCAQGSGQTASVTYARSYDGGSALSIGGAGQVSLYATRMTPPSALIAVVRYQGGIAPLATVRDGTGAWRVARETSSTPTGPWITSVQAFPPLSGVVTEIGLQSPSLPVTVGELAVMSPQDYTPNTPPPTQSVAAPASGDVTWTNPPGIWYANVFGCNAPGLAPQLLGRAFQPAFDPRYTIEPTPRLYPKYTIQPVTRAGIASQQVICR